MKDFLLVALVICNFWLGIMLYSKNDYPIIERCIGIQFKSERPCTVRIIPEPNESPELPEPNEAKANPEFLRFPLFKCPIHGDVTKWDVISIETKTGTEKFCRECVYDYLKKTLRENTPRIAEVNEPKK